MEQTSTPAERLAEIGLVPGDSLRMQHSRGRKWLHLTVRDLNPDGSLELVAPNNGIRTILPDERHLFEVKRKGPRGGTVWTPLGT